MALVIPANHANFILTISNNSGGLSARSSVAFGLDLTAGLTQADVGRIANILRDGLTSLYDNSWIFGPTHAVEGTGAAPLVWDDAGTEAGTGASSAYSSPANAYVVSKKTNIGGRQYRGRLYMPGVEEAAVGEDGVISGGYVNAFQTNFNNLRTNLIADAAIDNLVLFHDENTAGLLPPTVIQSFLVRNVVGTMRPRQRR
jgi:hypothetical protein